VPIVILGTDALLAAAPATPVQLAHACLRAGFGNVVPASWGDELIAAAVLRHLPRFGNGPAIQCSCPIVAHRLLTTGGDLRPVMLALVSPPVALARYVRALSHPTRTRITYVGGCPGASDESIDIRMTPEALIAMLAERDIALEEQPRVFESIIPPDRRRYRSQPGGVPTAERLWTDAGARALVAIEGDDIVGEIAQQLLAGANVLVDASARLGCLCSGAVPGAPTNQARELVVALEPPRANAPVVDEQAAIDLDLPLPAASRTPIDVAAVPGATTPATAMPVVPNGPPSLGPRISPPPPREAPPTPADTKPPRQPTPGAGRPVTGTMPVARDVEGRTLPRAYVARRRSPSARTVPAPGPQDSTSAESFAAPPQPAPQRSAASPVAPLTPVAPVAPAAVPVEPGPPAAEPRAPAASAVSTVKPADTWSSGAVQLRYVIYVLVVLAAIAVGISAGVALFVNRSLKSPPAASGSSSTPPQR
jgi:Iron only hydrogenase large subunit, C-terminal domain